MAAHSTPAPQTPAANPTADKPSAADIWAFRAFALLFLLTLLIGLLNFLFSFFKNQQPS